MEQKYITPDTKGNMRETDRVLRLEPIDGKAPRSSYGNVDPKLFTGENKLHAIKDSETCHWYFKYDSGGLPEPLKQKFTSFKMAYKFADDYYRTRNLMIKEIID